MDATQQPAAAPAALELSDVDKLEHIGKCATLLIATATSMMDPLVSLIGFSQAKGLLDQIAKVADTAVGAATGKVQAKQMEPFGKEAQRIVLAH